PWASGEIDRSRRSGSGMNTPAPSLIGCVKLFLEEDHAEIVGGSCGESASRGGTAQVGNKCPPAR
ncbi:MAG: hypothetical protein MRJ92_16310, partial [Nitrospira sp.]|nr:hypothetical protein [Nitrospira sp.]